MPSASKRDENSVAPLSVMTVQTPLAVGERPGYGVAHAGLRIVVRGDACPVYDHEDPSAGLFVDLGQDILDEPRFALSSRRASGRRRAAA